MSEIASTPLARATGLMGRETASGGMLLIWPFPAKQSLWMANVSIPLSAAFLSDAGIITGIVDMRPHDVFPHWSIVPVRYALEMSGGWFDANLVAPGMKVTGLQNAPRGI